MGVARPGRLEIGTHLDAVSPPRGGTLWPRRRRRGGDGGLAVGVRRDGPGADRSAHPDFGVRIADLRVGVSLRATRGAGGVRRQRVDPGGARSPTCPPTGWEW